MYKLIEGNMCDFSKLDSQGDAVLLILSGPHSGHQVSYRGSKFNCGAAFEVFRCSCGAEYKWSHGGCWQHGHDWPTADEGDSALKEALIGEPVNG
jgi:hypothetical protein